MITGAASARIGVAGLGRFGAAHVESLIELQNPPVAVADPDQAAVTRIAARLPGVSVYSDGLEMVARADLDAVIIVSPSATHVPLALAAAAQGVLALVEKPVAVTTEELGLILTVPDPDRIVPGHVLRFDPAHRRLKEVVDSGGLGTLRLITASRHRDRNHLTDFDDPDPILLTQVHDLDLACWLDGSTPAELASVGPLVAQRRPAVTTQAVSSNGVAWSLRASYLLPAGSSPRDDLEIMGDLGVARLTVRADGSRLTVSTGEQETVETWPVSAAPGLAEELASLLARLRGRRHDAPATLADAARVVRLAVAARSSLWADGAPTMVEPVSGAAAGLPHPATKAAPDQPLIPASYWHQLPSTYLYTGAQAPALDVVGRAAQAAFEHQSGGPSGRVALAEIELAAQGTVARWAGCETSDVAFMGDASTAWNMVAAGLRWDPGDNVVINRLEHPSVSFPFVRLAEDGLKSRVVSPSERWLIEPEDLGAAIDARTRAVVISHVSYVNGARHDLAAIAEIADRAGVPLFVDWSHSLGVLPVDSSLCAIGISASYKWALGPYGVGVAIWNRDRLPDFTPGLVGWRSTPDFFHDDRFERIRLGPTAERFRLGAASYSGIAGLAAGLDRLLGLGPELVAAHALDLSGAAHAALVDRGYDVITPAGADQRAGSVALCHDRAMDWADALARDGVLVWAGDGRLRASFHAMNGAADVARFVASLDRARQDRP